MYDFPEIQPGPQPKTMEEALNDISNELDINRKLIEERLDLDSFNKNLEFAHKWLNENLGWKAKHEGKKIHHDYEVEVLYTFIYNEPSDKYPESFKNHRFLLFGIERPRLAHMFRHNFAAAGKSTNKTFCGNGYYFSVCSSSAINYSDCGVREYERSADRGDRQPPPNYTGYIMACQVALGRCDSVHTQTKSWATAEKNREFNSLRIVGMKYAEKIVPIYDTDGGNEVKMDLAPWGNEDEDDEEECNAHPNHRFNFDEYLIKDANQIKPRLLIKFRCINHLNPEESAPQPPPPRKFVPNRH